MKFLVTVPVEVTLELDDLKMIGLYSDHGHDRVDTIVEHHAATNLQKSLEGQATPNRSYLVRESQAKVLVQE